jgi:hypothetical protein
VLKFCCAALFWSFRSCESVYQKAYVRGALSACWLSRGPYHEAFLFSPLLLSYSLLLYSLLLHFKQQVEKAS